MKIYDFNDETKYPLSNRDGILWWQWGDKRWCAYRRRVLAYQVSQDNERDE